MIESEFGPLVPVAPPHPSQPATDFVYADGGGRIGLIRPVSQPFCEACDRLRLTAEGQVRNCLFSTKEWDARALLRGGGSDDQIADLVRDCVWAKAPAHGIGSEDFVRPERAMYQIGG
jgi:cyclic pyranopterin phosphate synthase